MGLVQIKESQNLGFPNSFRVEAQGFSGELWILWKDSSDRVRVLEWWRSVCAP
jgi:hypothetical protein